MRQMRSTLIATTAIAIIAAAPAQASPIGESLFVQQADGGTLSAKKLVLTDVSRRTVRFDDRPRRTGGVMSLSRFVRQWRSDFRGDPPNAALVVHDAPRAQDVALLELRRPRYNARRGTLSFAVRRLSQTPSSRLRGFARRADGGRVRGFGRAELFIDPTAVDPQPAVIAARVPGNDLVTLSLSNSTLSYDSDGVFLSNLETPAREQGGIFVTTAGLVTLRSTSMTFQGGGAGGLTIDVITAIDPPSGGLLTGTAQVPSGATLTLGFAGQAAHTIPNGTFSIPYPSD